jgi:hypothetical protein
MVEIRKNSDGLKRACRQDAQGNNACGSSRSEQRLCLITYLSTCSALLDSFVYQINGYIFLPQVVFQKMSCDRPQSSFQYACVAHIHMEV